MCPQKAGFGKITATKQNLLWQNSNQQIRDGQKSDQIFLAKFIYKKIQLLHENHFSKIKNENDQKMFTYAERKPVKEIKLA